jgi:HTH-type transcriptional regulator/antitoxin HigA
MSIEARPYSATALKEAIKELQTCLQDVEGVKKASSILSKAGLRFVVVEYLPRAKLDGACFWLDKGKSPVIALSLRLDRVDNFWHTLFHEIDHVAHGEGKQTPIVDIVETEHAPDATLPEEEMRANSSAAKYCIPEHELNEWVSQTPRVASRGNILAFAERVGVHPGLVVGQLQHRGLIPYSFHRELLERVRSLVISATPTDGFGEK